MYTIRSNTLVLASAKMSIHKNSREFPWEFCERRIPGNSRTGIPGGLDRIITPSHGEQRVVGYLLRAPASSDVTGLRSIVGFVALEPMKPAR